MRLLIASMRYRTISLQATLLSLLLLLMCAVGKASKGKGSLKDDMILKLMEQMQPSRSNVEDLSTPSSSGYHDKDNSQPSPEPRRHLLGEHPPASYFGWQKDSDALKLPKIKDILEFISDPMAALSPPPLAPEYEKLLHGGGKVVVSMGNSTSNTTLSPSDFLDITSSVFGVVSEVFDLANNVAATVSSAIAIPTTGIGYVTGVWSFYLSLAQAEMMLSSDLQSQANMLYQRWKDALLRCADTLQAMNNGTYSQLIDKSRARINHAGGLLETWLHANITFAN